MPHFPSADIRGIVFDLDGTLYECDRFAAEIQNAAVSYIARLKGLPHGDAGRLMADTRQRMSDESGTVQTISAVCTELGGSVQELHRHFERTLRPESYLVRDERVIGLLERLARHFSLYIYTNNNRVLTARIMNYLGLAELVHGTFTIDDSWRGKPDEEMVTRLLDRTGLAPHEALFVGDRYDVDLRVPEQLGCPVFLSQTVEQLLRLESHLISKVDADSPATPADQQAVRS